MGQEDINPNFKTSIYFGMKALTKEEILKKLEATPFIYSEFKNKGILDSTKYSFITKITFSTWEKNSVEGDKTQKEILQAKENLKLVEDYFNKYRGEYSDPYEIGFESIDNNDGKCVLYNINRFDTNKLKNYMYSI